MPESVSECLNNCQMTEGGAVITSAPIFAASSTWTGLRTLVRGFRDSSIAGLSYSPDGRQIAYVRQYPADAHDRSVMCTAPVRGGRERERFQTDHYIGSVDWQPLPRRR